MQITELVSMCGLKWVKASVSKTFFLNPNTFFAKQKKETIAREKGKQENEKDFHDF